MLLFYFDSIFSLFSQSLAICSFFFQSGIFDRDESSVLISFEESFWCGWR